MIDKEVLQDVLYKYGDTHFVDNELNFKSPFWNDIEKDMGHIIKSKSIYLTVSQDRFNLLTNLRTRLGIMVPDIQSDMSISSCNEESEDEEMNSVFDDDESLATFHIDITYEVYQKMKPIEVEYGNGKIKEHIQY